MMRHAFLSRHLVRRSRSRPFQFGPQL
ncbi:TPA: hypothetical protein N0F65_005218 [Lagenidium giganteum]|uniref:Uncharacterized protein n=1 Tax=Lagenidium giganteum TaxID=4803 RepID=A0AAV2YWC0_9STRA|nr:TPA: hypothetical protein N0F65_005218 [Lagenidium giganteum]